MPRLAGTNEYERGDGDQEIGRGDRATICAGVEGVRHDHRQGPRDRARRALDGSEPVYLEVEDWQVLAIDDELRLPLAREAMAERARFIRSGLNRGR